jgi:hypothetical protein
MLEEGLLKVIVALHVSLDRLTVERAGLALVAAVAMAATVSAAFNMTPKLGELFETAGMPAADAPVPAVLEKPLRAATAPPALASETQAAKQKDSDVVQGKETAKDQGPVPPATRYQIAAALQAELLRRGCYQGPVSGAWTSASRRAMQSFTEAVNASLPVDKPDAVLVALLQSNPNTRCAAPAPQQSVRGAETVAAGQALAGSSRSQRDEARSREAAQEAAARPEGEAAHPGTRQSATRAAGLVPPEGVYEQPRKERARLRKSQESSFPPAKFAKSLVKGIQKALSGF